MSRTSPANSWIRFDHRNLVSETSFGTSRISEVTWIYTLHFRNNRDVYIVNGNQGVLENVGESDNQFWVYLLTSQTKLTTKRRNLPLPDYSVKCCVRGLLQLWSGNYGSTTPGILLEQRDYTVENFSPPKSPSNCCFLIRFFAWSP